MNIVEFLLARIAEDENAAQHAGSFTPWTEAMQNDNYGHLTIQPTRVLAECAAKRAIIDDWYAGANPDTDWGAGFIEGHDSARENAVRALAAVYADHPEYRQEWRP